MKYLHTMVRVTDLEASLHFYRDALGLEVLRRTEHEAGRFTLVFLAAPGQPEAQVELTYNWDPEAPSQPPGQGDALSAPQGGQGSLGRPGSALTGGRNFGHIAFAVDNIYATCQRLVDHGVQVLRPPRDGRMAFVRSPDQISIELLQAGPALAPAEPWNGMPNVGSW